MSKPNRTGLIQGSFYLATGLWPLFHRRSFEAVTGPKTDWWLVETVGILVSAIGSSLLLAHRSESQLPSKVLGLGAAAGLAFLEMKQVAERRISPVYLVDAAVELGLCGAWLARGRA